MKWTGQMLRKELQDAIQAIDDLIAQLQERGISDELLIAALARQLYNRIQLASSDNPDRDLDNE